MCNLRVAGPLEGSRLESTVQKKMAAVHFTTIPCEPNRDISLHRKPYFGKIHPCTEKIVYARFEVFRPFQDFRVLELWVNVPVAIFFGTVD